MKKLLWILVFAFGINVTAQKAVISNFRIENSHKDRVYFDVKGDISGLTKQGFVISGKSISSINTSENYFVVSSSFNFWDNNTIRLGENSDASDVNTMIHNFTLSYIKNNILEPSLSGNEYYVDRSVSSSGDGSSEEKAFKTIQEGINKATSGDKIWIKAKNYGNENLLISQSGAIDNPIIIEGYKINPGDITSMYYEYGMSLDASKMPIIDGGNPNTNIGLHVSGNYIIVRNLQITNYLYGVQGNAGKHDIIFNRIIAKNMGSLTAGSGMAFSFKTYDSGYTQSRYRLIDCVAENGAEGLIKFRNSHGLLVNFKGYDDNNDITGNAADYYMQISGYNNIVINSELHKKANDGHHGHGFSTKYIAEYNLFDNNLSVNIENAFMARHEASKYNVWKNSESHANVAYSDLSAALVVIYSGASYNVFENLYGHKLRKGFYFIDNTEGTTVHVGDHNIFRNIIIDDVREDGFWISNNESTSANFSDNKFYNITFNNIGQNLFKIQSDVNLSGNEFKNCIINDVNNYYKDGTIYKAPNGFTFDYCNIFNSWSNSLGNNSLNVDPKFENATGGNFRLRSDSPLINKGKDLNEVQFDFDRNLRPQGTSTDIGAFEYQDNTTSSVTANAGEDQIICLGDSVTLISSGGSSFVWNTGATTSSITVNPNSTTTYTVTVSEGADSDSDSVQVTVNNVTANAGSNVNINGGERTTLTASGGSTYLWNTGATTSSITVNPNSTTTYSVTVTNNECEDTDEVTVTVNATTGSVNANGGEDVTICYGENTILTASGGSTYSWSTGATTQSITVSPNSTTTYTVTVSEEGSSSDTDSVLVTVNDLPIANAGSDVTIEEGESIKLTANGGGTYAWSNGATSKSITVSPNSTTTYSVTVTNNGCEDTDEVQVIVESKITNPPPADAFAGDDISICLGENITLTANGGETYLWSTGDTSKSINVKPTRTTTYTLSATRGGITNSDTVTITVENCSAINEEIQQDDFVVYPNPTNDIINIKANNDYDSLNLNIHSINGSIVYSDKMQANNNITFKTIDLSNLTRGVYIVRLYNSSYHKTKKILLH